MTGSVSDVLTVLKEYGLAGMLAWLFWWTLRRMMASHDTTVRNLKEQLESQTESARQTSDRFSEVVENHIAHVSDAVARFEVSLSHHLDNQRQVSSLLLDVLNRIDDRLARTARSEEVGL
jgi:hypothetical protein